ncbi:MAG: JAB domain-containing protein [Chlorobium sp.]
MVHEVYKGGALLANANSNMVVPNHPSDNPEPSRADRDVTTKLIEAGNLRDHIIIGNNQPLVHPCRAGDSIRCDWR